MKFHHRKRAGRRFRWLAGLKRPLVLLAILMLVAFFRDPARVIREEEKVLTMSGRFPLCEVSGADTACISDGDSIRLAGGAPLRVVGFDTAEIGRPQCEAERALAISARAELQRWVNRGPFEIHYVEERDRYGRRLGRLERDGEDVADHLIRRGLARPYRGGQRQGWC
ncbi:thermonuclease family protein [Sphingomicrobium aestuariivivum]|uniref:thermonuclease family protein n=1 Tax=Sphingomicrobium aestuariivivum TaxID=1582356 RepID=UPI001FD6664E|nr:thermonuclease family protein [Sphingomicrobium aestuariivivum]MCJ8190868.1 thermonuclease family protein [Sphingomicrobium aestuariivivum]